MKLLLLLSLTMFIGCVEEDQGQAPSNNDQINQFYSGVSDIGPGADVVDYSNGNENSLAKIASDLKNKQSDLSIMLADDAEDDAVIVDIACIKDKVPSADTIAQMECSPKKVAVCHIPQKNEDNAHIIIISKNAFENLVEKNDRGSLNYLVDCNASAPELKSMKIMKCNAACDKDADAAVADADAAADAGADADADADAVAPVVVVGDVDPDAPAGGNGLK